jgi:hypothetical protein
MVLKKINDNEPVLGMQEIYNFYLIFYRYYQCFGSALVICGFGSSILDECGSGSSVDPDSGKRWTKFSEGKQNKFF